MVDEDSVGFGTIFTGMMALIDDRSNDHFKALALFQCFNFLAIIDDGMRIAAVSFLKTTIEPTSQSSPVRIAVIIIIGHSIDLNSVQSR